MKSFIKIFMVIVFSITFLQATVTLDASSKNNMAKSIKEMKNNLSLENKTKLENAFLVIFNDVMYQLMQEDQPKKEDLDNVMLEKFKKYNNMTADQIIVSANKLNSEVDKRKVKGGFGIKLGDMFEIKKSIATTKTNNGTNLYEINPPKKLKYFKKYYVILTPKTNLIYEIWGTKEYKNKETCTRDLELLETIMEKKYGKFDKPSFSLEERRMVMTAPTYVKLSCSGFIDTTLYLQYGDSNISELAKKEAADIEAQKIDTSAL